MHGHNLLWLMSKRWKIVRLKNLPQAYRPTSHVSLLNPSFVHLLFTTLKEFPFEFHDATNIFQGNFKSKVSTNNIKYFKLPVYQLSGLVY